MGEESVKWICAPDSILNTEQERRYGSRCKGEWIWPCAYVRGHLRKDFVIHGTIEEAYAYYECDNEFDLFLNGRPVEHARQGCDVTELLQEGNNTVHIRVYQTGDAERFTSAIRGEIRLMHMDRVEEVIYTDSSWTALRVGTFYVRDEPEDWLEREDFPQIEMVCGKIHPFFLRHSFYFKKEFRMKRPVSSAILYVSAKGLYKAFMNGSPVSDDKLAPGAMEKIYEYQEYDISRFLQDGENAVGFITGNGWYNCKSWGELTAKKNMIWFKIRLTYSDGTIAYISSDADCQAAFSPLTDNDLQFGERYDARKEIDDWCKAGKKVGAWYPVQVSEETEQKLCRQNYPSVKPMKCLSAVKKMQLSDQRILLDFGENISGRIRIRICNGHAGDHVIIRYYERFTPEGELCDGPYLPVFFPEDAKSGKAVWSVRNADVYICKEAAVQRYESNFTYTGFRYVVAEGVNEVADDTIQAVIMHQDLEERGSIETSYQPIMQLWEMTKRSYRGNIVGGPTDCPTREKNFWNGDIQTFAPTACWYMDNRKFLDRWSAYGRKIEYGVYGWEDEEYILPWTLYWFYGEREILERKYKSILQLAERRKSDERNHLTDHAYAPYGDHLSLVNVPADFFADCYYCLMLRRISQIAEILGDVRTASAYREKSDLSEKAFHEKYYLEEISDYSPRCQSGIVLPIAFGLTPERYRNKVVKTLDSYCRENGYRLTTGYMATPFLLGILCEYGYVETAWRIMEQTEYPSWRYLIGTGVDTMTENWEGLTSKDLYASMNHYGLGSVCRWFFESLGGIRVFEGTPGFQKIVLRPVIIPQIGAFEVTYKTHTGIIRVAWKVQGDFADIEIEIPKGSSAMVTLPNGKTKELQNSRFTFSEIRYQYDGENSGTFPLKF